MNTSTRQQRELAKEIIDYEPPYKLDEVPELQALKGGTIPWPKKGKISLAPKPVSLKNPKPSSPLPRADIVVVTWTVAEGFALGDVLTPGYRDVRPRKKPPKNTTPWYPYRPSNFEKDYKANLRRVAPAVKANRLGTYCMTEIYNDKAKRALNVLCFKSELHLNRDWIKNTKSYRTVPVADLFVQIINEARPKLIITAGTAGATLSRTPLGDVMMTRAAQFRLSKAFKLAPFRKDKYACTSLPRLKPAYLASTVSLLDRFKNQLDPKLLDSFEKKLGPNLLNRLKKLLNTKRTPIIWFDGSAGSYSSYFPILTTDGFEFGTSKGPNGNYLGGRGCGVEMGDAVLGMVIKYLNKPTAKPQWDFTPLASPEALQTSVPEWLVIRNASDPQIDATQSKEDQTKEAVAFYKAYGYWTSVNSSIAVWAAARGAQAQWEP
jgi:hypothetical protein